MTYNNHPFHPNPIQPTHSIAQIALDPPPPSVKRANVEKKVPHTILASPYTPGQTWEKSAPNHPVKPLHPPPPPYGQCP